MHFNQCPIYILISVFDVTSALQGVVIFCLVFFDKAMVIKIKEKLGGIPKLLRKQYQVKSLETKQLSLSQLNNRSVNCNENDYVGVRFSRQKVSRENITYLKEGRHYSRSCSASTIATLVTGSINDVVAEVHELDAVKEG